MRPYSLVCHQRGATLPAYNAVPMRAGLITRLLFVSYCLEAGMFLLMVPWSPAWDRTIAQLPVPMLVSVLRWSFTRAALAGFGLVHLIWGIHDLDALWPRGRSQAEVPPGVDAKAPNASNPGV